MSKASRERLNDVFSSDLFAALAVGSAGFTDNFMFNVIVPIFPQILSKRVHLPGNEVQFWLSVALAVFGGALFVSNLVAAYITNRIGSSSKTPFFAGLVFMTLSTLLFYLSTDIRPIIIARVLQGSSAAFVWVSGFAYLTSHVEGHYLGTAMGIVTAATSGGELAGPLAGSLLYQFAGHYAVLGLCLGILGVDFILRALLRGKPKPVNGTASRNEGRPLLTENGHASYSSVTANGEEADEESISSTSTLPVPPAVQISYLDIGTTWWATLVAGTVRAALEATLPLFVSSVFGWSTSASGAIIFAMLCPTLLSPLIGRATMKFGPRWLNTIFLLVNCGALVALPFCQRNEKASQVAFVALVLVIGTAGAVVTATNVIAFSVAAKHSEKSGGGDTGGKLFGSMSTAWALALFLGPLIADLFLEKLGWFALAHFFAGINLASAILAVFSWRVWTVPSDN